jgi:hypothetical protein
MAEFIHSSELQSSVYVYVPSHQRLGTFSTQPEERRVRVHLAVEFAGVDQYVTGLGEILGYLQPPSQWRHLTFTRNGESSSMYRAFERLLAVDLLPVVKLEDLAEGAKTEAAIPVRNLLVQAEIPRFELARIKDLIARRVPIDFALRESFRGLSIVPMAE